MRFQVCGATRDRALTYETPSWKQLQVPPGCKRQSAPHPPLQSSPPTPGGALEDPRLLNYLHSPPLPPVTALCAGARESFTCEPALWSGAELTWPWAGCTWPGVPECVCAGGEAVGPGRGGASGDTEETGEGWGHPAAGMPCGIGI